jgi:TonB-linked SusC/RagA family outer membrane protein
MVGNTYVQVDFLEHFSFKSSFGVDLEYASSESFTPVFFVSAQQQNTRSSLNKGTSNRSQLLWENTLNYSRDIGVHRIEALAGYTMQDNQNEFYNLSGLDLIRNGRDFWYIDATDRETLEASNNVSDAFNYSMISFLGRVNYVYDSRYLFTATFRRDGSSKFIGDNRWGNFPSLAVGWNIINEDFMVRSRVFSNLKLRASWGIIGNEKIPYRDIYSVVANNQNGVFGIDETQFFGQTFGGLGNPDLTWENTYQTDIGLEVGFFADKLTAEIDYFNKRTEDILIPLDVPGYLGNGGADVRFNAAEVRNKGFELTLNWRDNVSDDFNYFVALTGTTIDNETISVSGTGGPDEVITADFNGNTVTRTIPGIPIGSFFGYLTDGVFQNQDELNSYPHRSDAGVGDLRFVDINNDGQITGADRTTLGSPIPTYFYGISLGANYKGVDLSMDFQGQGGNEIYNLKETVRPGLYNFEQHVYDYWRPEQPSNVEPRPSQGGYNFLPSSRFIQNGAFFRLRNITIGYTLPPRFLDKVFLKSVRLYARGTNVFTITDFTGYSPEVASESAIFNNIDRSTYPVTAVYSLGLDIKF